MTNHSNNSHTSNDTPLNEEQMMLPCLLTLDSDIELLEKEMEEQSLEPMTVHVSPTDINTTTPTACSFATDTLIADDTNTENTPCTVETLNALRNQLAMARKEIVDLRNCIGRNREHLFNHGIRLIEVERQLILLQPTVRNANFLVNPLASQTTQSGTPTKMDTKIQVANPRGNPNTEFIQPQTKRAKTVQTHTTEPEKGTYHGHKLFCSLCSPPHVGPCNIPCSRCKIYGHQVQDCKLPPRGSHSKVFKTCFECGNTGHIRTNCPLLTGKSSNNKKRNIRVKTVTNSVNVNRREPNKTAGTSLHDN